MDAWRQFVTKDAGWRWEIGATFWPLYQGGESLPPPPLPRHPLDRPHKQSGDGEKEKFFAPPGITRRLTGCPARRLVTVLRHSCYSIEVRM
jgi:hypothetical protein